MLPPAAFASLLARWREDAAVLRRRGATGHADVLEGAVADLETTLTMQAAEALTLAEAAARSGYTVDSLARLMRAGKLPNVGRRHAPRVLVADLPRKPHLAGASRQTARLTAERRTS